jgi:hypothetical protein
MTPGTRTAKKIDNADEQVARLRDSQFLFHIHQNMHYVTGNCKPFSDLLFPAAVGDFLLRLPYTPSCG